MTKRMALVWLGLLMAVSVAVSGCSGVALGAGGNEPPVDGGEAVDGELAAVDEVSVIIMETLPGTAAVIAQGYLPDGCTSIVDMRMTIDEEAGLFQVTLGTYRDPEAMCTMALVPFEEVVELPIMGLAAGTYTVEVNGVGTTFELAVDNVPVEG